MFPLFFFLAIFVLSWQELGGAALPPWLLSCVLLVFSHFFPLSLYIKSPASRLQKSYVSGKDLAGQKCMKTSRILIKKEVKITKGMQITKCQPMPMAKLSPAVDTVLLTSIIVSFLKTICCHYNQLLRSLGSPSAWPPVSTIAPPRADAVHFILWQNNFKNSPKLAWKKLCSQIKHSLGEKIT